MPKRNNITIICEGNTEYNYLSGLKRHTKSILNVVPMNANGGSYSNVLKRLKQLSPVGTVARFAAIDFDRYLTVESEDKHFQELLNYCENEQKKGNPTFLIVSNPDFDVYVLHHDSKYKNQDKLIFLENNYRYKNLSEFKNDDKIFEKFNPSLNEYKNYCSSVITNHLVVKNKYTFDKQTYNFKKMGIVFNPDNSVYRLSNMKDLIDLLD